MATNYVSSGSTVTFTAGATIAAGDIAVLGTALFGVAHDDYESGDTGVLYLEGEFDLAKQAALAISVGDVVYWDTTAKEVDKTDTNQLIGVCTAAAAAGDAVVRVRIQQAG